MPKPDSRVSYLDLAQAIAGIEGQVRDYDLKKESAEAKKYAETQLPPLRESMVRFAKLTLGASIPLSLQFPPGYSGDRDEHDKELRNLLIFVDDLTDTLNAAYYSAYEAKAAGPVGAVPPNHRRITYLGFSVDVQSAVGLDATDERKIIAAVQDPKQRHRSSNCTGQPAGNAWWYTHDYGRNRLLLVTAIDENTNPKRVVITKEGSVNSGVHNFR